LKPGSDYRLMWKLVLSAKAGIAIDAVSGRLIFCNPEK